MESVGAEFSMGCKTYDLVESHWEFSLWRMFRCFPCSLLVFQPFSLSAVEQLSLSLSLCAHSLNRRICALCRAAFTCFLVVENSVGLDIALWGLFQYALSSLCRLSCSWKDDNDGGVSSLLNIGSVRAKGYTETHTNIAHSIATAHHPSNT